MTGGPTSRERVAAPVGLLLASARKVRRYALDRSEGGLGIGLTVVRSIVQLHGGTVAVHSDGPGCGSEFTVSLPLAEPDSAGVLTAGRGFAPAAPERSREALRVLVVDDNVDAAETLASILELWGHAPVVAHDAQRALQLIEALRPNVALMDIGLPGMNGYDLARATRSLPHGEQFTLVALTGYGDAASRQQGIEAGFDHHLTKPVDLDALEGLLASLSLNR